MLKYEIAQLIHYYRKQSGLSQLQLARLAGVGKTVIYVRLNTLLKILDVLNIQMKFETPFPLTRDDKI